MPNSTFGTRLSSPWRASHSKRNLRSNINQPPWRPRVIQSRNDHRRSQGSMFVSSGILVEANLLTKVSLHLDVWSPVTSPPSLHSPSPSGPLSRQCVLRPECIFWRLHWPLSPPTWRFCFPSRRTPSDWRRLRTCSLSALERLTYLQGC